MAHKHTQVRACRFDFDLLNIMVGSANFIPNFAQVHCYCDDCFVLLSLFSFQVCNVKYRECKDVQDFLYFWLGFCVFLKLKVSTRKWKLVVGQHPRVDLQLCCLHLTVDSVLAVEVASHNRNSSPELVQPYPSFLRFLNKFPPRPENFKETNYQHSQARAAGH